MGLSQHILSKGWSFKDSEESDTWMPVPVVPSVVHQDLQANKKIEDPFIGFNELKTKWVNERSWTYRNIFQKSSLPAGSTAELVFDGLDTFATVKLDGKVILESTNMFLAHRVDVTTALGAEAKEHVLEIDFDSAMIRARALRDQDTKHNWASFNGDPARMAVRKAQYHWGWDWGPGLMTAGIWRGVRVEVYSARIADLWTDVQLAVDYQEAKVSAFAEVDAGSGSGSYRAKFTLSLLGREVAAGESSVENNTAKMAFEIKQPSLWWPHGYGNPSLYELKVTLTNGENELHQLTKKIGIRTAEVIQRPDKHGESFFFRINGVEIFCGGSCWIPADSLLPAITPERYRKWVELMVSGRQMMTRVWGGGIYEDDSFYDACDELGVMVWQDFMFACGNYPTWPELLESIKQEAVYNVRRLRHHPSVVIYAGNNEDYQVQEQNGLEYDYEDKNPENWLKTDFPARYIYEKLLPSVVRDLAPRVFYHPGSPWGGGKVTSDPTVGDLHQWNVWHGKQEKYQIFDTLGGRFNSEFGMQAFPHIQTIGSFVEHKADKHPQSHVLDFHNKAEGHERRLATYLAENVRLATDMETYIYLTQVIQAEAMMFAYRGWRRQWGDDRHCGGALVWQLNDCWPGMSWAIADYHLRPKPAYYAVSRALKPLAIGVQREHHDWSVANAEPPQTSTYRVWVASSLREEISGRVKVELRFISVATGVEIRERFVSEDLRIVPNGTTAIVDGIIDHVACPEAHVLAARLWVDNQVVARDVDWPQPFKYLDLLSNRGLDMKREGQILRIITQKPVKCLVFEERDGVSVSDSAMDIVPGDEQAVTVTGLGEDTLEYRYLQ